MKDVLYGTAAGVAGAIAWAVIAHLTQYEIGYIAWGIGVAVGFAVAAGNRDGTRSPAAAGAIAVVLATLAIIGGKMATVNLAMPSDEEIVQMFVEYYDDEEYVISYVADDVALEFEQAGRAVDWPVGSDPTTASAEVDYPPEVWEEALARWQAMTPDDRNGFRADLVSEARGNVESNLQAIRASMSQEGLLGSFSPMDLLFFGLAIVTAWGFGSGRRGPAREIPPAEWSDDRPEPA